MNTSQKDALPGLTAYFGADAVAIVRKLLAAGHDAVIVGGPVRDVLLGGTPQDVDIATAATPDVVRRLFPRTYVQGSGEVHGTIGVVVGKETYEVTTYRRDVETDGRHAEVVFTRSLEEDLARRDFTINAIAARPNQDDTGTIIDPFEGRLDLESRKLRAVGEPTLRFQEDYLRLLRAYRFAARYGFTIDEHTHAAMLESMGGMASLSRERIRDEILKMSMQAATPGSLAAVLTQMESDGALKAILPEALRTRETILQADAGPASNPRLRLALLLRTAGAEAAAQTCRRLAFSNADKGYVCELVRHHDEAAAIASAGSDPARIRRLAYTLGSGASLRDMLQMLRATSLDAHSIDIFAAAIAVHEAESPPLNLRDLAVTGQDVMIATGARGPEVGQRLQALLDAVLEDPQLNTKARLLAMLTPASSPNRPLR